MKEKKQIVNAIMSNDLIRILNQTGQYEELINGNIKCECCGRVISVNNISTLIPYKDGDTIKLKFYCDNIDCVNSEK